MGTLDSEIVMQEVRERYLDAWPRIITIQGGQFRSRESKAILTLWQASHVMNSPYYPQSKASWSASAKPSRSIPSVRKPR